MFLGESYIRSSVSQRDFKICWATRSNCISSLHNRRMNGSCPFQSKSQGSWQESWEAAEREWLWGLNSSFTERARPQTLGDFPGTHCLTFSVFWSHSGPSLSHTLLPGAATPTAPSVPRLPRHTQVPHAGFQKGSRKPFLTLLCIHPFPITSFLRSVKSKKEDPVI